MMYTAENNTLKLKLGDGVVVNLRDEYIIEIISEYYFTDVAGIEDLSIPHVWQPGVIIIIDSNLRC